MTFVSSPCPADILPLFIKYKNVDIVAFECFHYCASRFSNLVIGDGIGLLHLFGDFELRQLRLSTCVKYRILGDCKIKLVVPA